MRKKNRNVEIFSLSAIDLFASSLGAFFVFTAILMPWYPNMKEGGAKTEKLAAEIEEKQREIAKTGADVAAVEVEIEKRRLMAAESTKAESEKARLVAETREIERANTRSEATIAGQFQTLEDIRKKLATLTLSSGDTDFSVLGITSKAKSFVIVMDLSGSMDQWSSTATNTLREIIEPFHDQISFAIIGYQNFGVTQIWPAPGVMALADAKSKASARAFIDRLPNAFAGSTPTKAALVQALKYRAEAIILVSDGDPTDERPESILSTITAMNANRFEINTVAVGNYLKAPSLILFLNDLAKRNRGKFVGVIR